MDIEKVAKENPDKIITNKIDFKEEGPSETELIKIISIFGFDEAQKKSVKKLISILYKILLEKDANLIEINPLIITKKNEILCLDRS